MSTAFAVMPAPPPPEAVRLGTGQGIPLAGALTVEDGFVEVYAGCGATRRFLAAFGRGSLLFGPRIPAGLRLVAPEGAGLAPLSEDGLSAACRDPARRAGLAAALDAFVTALSEGLARQAGPRPEAAAWEPGTEVATAAGSAGSALRGVVWIAPASPDGLRFLDAASLGPAPTPLTPATWIRAERDAAARALPTADLLAGAWRDALDGLADLAGRAVLALAERHLSAEEARLDAQERLTADDLARAGRSFLGILAAGGGGVLAPDSGSDAADDLDHALDAVAGPGPARPHEVSSRGALPLEARLERRGLLARSVTLRGAWWRRDRGPLLGFLAGDGAPVALLPDRRGRYRLLRRGAPARPLDAGTAAALQARAFTVTEALPAHPLRWRDLVGAGLGRVRPELATLVLASLAAALLGLLVPVATGIIVDTFIPDGLAGELLLLGLALALLNLGIALLKAAAEGARLRMDGRLAAWLQAGIMDRVLRFPARTLTAFGSADLTSRLMSIDPVRRSLTGTLVTSLTGAIYAACSLVLLVAYAPLAAAVALALLAVLLGVAFLAGRAQLGALTSGEAMTASVTALTLQIVQSVPVLRAFGAERRAFALWGRNSAVQRARGLRARVAAIRFETVLAAYDSLALALMFAFLAWRMDAKDRMTTGAFMAFILSYQQFLAATQTVARGLVQWIQAEPTLKRALPLLATVPEAAATARPPAPPGGRLELAAVTFRYAPGGPPLLDRVSLSVEPGRFVALTGPSGAGKSTLLNLILGFERPEAGAVLIDGRDIATLDLAAMRRGIGVVRQNGRLLAGSIFENLVGANEGGVEEAWRAAELAGIAEEIRALPLGLHTLVNEGTSTLSGGQVQRLLLARALLGSPKLLLLDEATSALDTATQAVITANIERLGVSRLVVAHRLSTVRHADVIHFMEGGRIVESGRFEDLMAAGGAFAAFARRGL
ncbi:ATP-binding cassette domain-containing protein [Methylobacterium nonmethylotrophicum]|uniref:ATP-binding cassette domain-containing protein n=1 Tax=Methylobacterium nonmethylotrophicum TaxID=1141884 RepID=A0A4Z0NU71_9HYPH|nr:ATP-binding cassette domain-containing protein [Methylobacterium nonmethylotrophicum]TGE01066.1 ATP-binding cassette domain-containing protein [Methylobacterium nonmethylotrophicum]